MPNLIDNELTTAQQEAWETKMAEGVEHRKHSQVARDELRLIATCIHDHLASWERRHDLTVTSVSLERAAVATVCESGERTSELVNVNIEAGLWGPARG